MAIQKFRIVQQKTVIKIIFNQVNLTNIKSFFISNTLSSIKCSILLPGKAWEGDFILSQQFYMQILMNKFCILHKIYIYFSKNYPAIKVQMLFVETNNQKQQLILEEEFSREGNLFAVPLSKTQEIKSILQTILVEIFGRSHPSSKLHIKPLQNCSQVVKKLATFLQNALTLKISLECMREILLMIKQQEKKISLYQQYIMQMNRQFMMDMEQNCRELDEFAQMSELEQLFLQEINKGNRNYDILDADLMGFDYRTDLGELSLKNSKKIVKNQLNTNKCEYQICVFGSNNEDASTMHTLKSEVPNNPKFGNALELDNLNNIKINSSFQYSDQNQNKQPEEENSPIYCPPWKKLQNDHKDLIKSLLSTEETEKKKKSLDDSSDFADLSNRVHPTPSFLHNESLKQMIKKQKNEEIRKSNILRQALTKPWLESQCCTSPKGQKYSSNLRQIKYQNKLRKKSEKRLNTKEDFERNAQVQQKKAARKSTVVLSSAKMNKLFKIREKKQENQQMEEIKTYRSEAYLQKFQFQI